ncbi:molybdopterin-dependent oxidoreductase [Chloroflexota bacterium]
MEDSSRKVIKTSCHGCHACCGINVHVEEGKIVRVEGMREHPSNQGKLCAKAAGIVDWVYSPERLKYPMKRENGDWKRISWDEALDTIADKLAGIKEQYGAKALAVCLGMAISTQGTVISETMRRFTDVYGTPNVFSVDSMCYRAHAISYMLTLGRYILADTEKAKCVVLWATNPEASHQPIAWRLTKEKLEGRKLIVIDPRRTSVAKKAHLHVQPRPGTDCALALGMINVIISEGLYDKEIVEEWTTGFDELSKHVESYTPEEVERITWVPAEMIKELAEVYATTKPACIFQGFNGLDQSTSGVQVARAIAILQGITGNIDTPGGFITGPFPLFRHLRLMDKMEGLPLGADRFPLSYSIMGRLFGEGQGMVLSETLLTDQPYPVKAMIVSGTNVVLTWPHSNKTREALNKLDFLVVMDLFMNETAKQADIVLPAASFLERDGLPDLYGIYCLPYIMMRKKVIEIGECWSDLKFWLELAKRMGYEEYFPWKDEEELFDYFLQPAKLTTKYLREEKPAGVFYSSLTYNKYKTKGMMTQSGKIELYSKVLEQMGYEPLPVHKESPESPISNPDLAREYPLILITGGRVLERLHSQPYYVSQWQKRYPEPLVDIHSDTATEYGIKDGDMTVVGTRRGSITLKARVTEDILPGVVSIPHGWDEANVNLLTDETPADPVSGTAALKSLLCKVRKQV